MVEQKMIKVELKHGDGLNAYPRFKSLREQGWQIDAAGTIQRFDGSAVMLVRLTRPDVSELAVLSAATPASGWAGHRKVAS